MCLGLCISCWGNSFLGPLAHCFSRSRGPIFDQEKIKVRIRLLWETQSSPLRAGSCFLEAGSKDKAGIFWDLCFISFWYCSFGHRRHLYGALRSRDIFATPSPTPSRPLLLWPKDPHAFLQISLEAVFPWVSIFELLCIADRLILTPVGFVNRISWATHDISDSLPALF